MDRQTYDFVRFQSEKAAEIYLLLSNKATAVVNGPLPSADRLDIIGVIDAYEAWRWLIPVAEIVAIRYEKP